MVLLIDYFMTGLRLKKLLHLYVLSLYWVCFLWRSGNVHPDFFLLFFQKSCWS